jgi:peptidoglycan hydrolase-like protein with peptidoglycan-binding domain
MPKKEDDLLKMGLAIGGIWLLSKYMGGGVAQAANFPSSGLVATPSSSGGGSLTPVIQSAINSAGQVFKSSPTSSNVAVTSDVVAWVQQSVDFLMSAGIPIDGQMGPLTRGAISSYQSNKGLYASGNIDQSLIDALNQDLQATTREYPTLTQFMNPDWQPVYA